MLKWGLLLTGVLLLITNHATIFISGNVQIVLFVLGMVLVGIPHGAADMLIAKQTAINSNTTFSLPLFLAIYLSKVLLFGIFIYYFTGVGIILFIILASYHFGETDLYFINTTTAVGKLLVFTYGLLILATLLLHHITTVNELIQPLLQHTHITLNIRWIQANNSIILSITTLLLLATLFIYLLNNNDHKAPFELVLIQNAIIVLLLYFMPLILGFTFYFIIWHSVVSLHKILLYLHKHGKYSYATIVKQIGLYSSLSYVGITIIVVIANVFVSSSNLILLSILSLSVLTLPHMHIMKSMYGTMRTKYAA